HFGGEGLVRLVVLHAAMHLVVVEIPVLVDEGLPHDVVGRVVEVLGSEGRPVNHQKARVSPLDDMALNQLHQPPPALLSLLTPAQCLPSCAWLAAVRRVARRTSTRWP